MVEMQGLIYSNQFKLTGVRSTTKLQYFNSRWSIWQLITVSIHGLLTLACVLIIISCFCISIPSIGVTIATLNTDPSLKIDLNEFPNIKYNCIVYAKVENYNFFPLPVIITAKGSLNSENPSDYIIEASSSGSIAKAKGITHIKAQASVKLPLFQYKSRFATIALDACGMLGNERTGLIGNVKAYAYVGYGMFSVPIKYYTRTNIPVFCPLVEENLAQLILGYVSTLIPDENQYNGELNNELNSNNLIMQRY